MTAERSDTHSESLADLRREIDRIDETMHRLLMERGAIIDRLVAVKRTAESGSAFRPGREADMMRRLLARHHGRLPFSAVEHIWRTIIATFTHVQAPYCVHMDGSGGTSGDEGAMRDVVRFQTGFDVPLVVHENARAVAAAVRASAGDLGFVGLGAVDASWWNDLGPGEPQIMARLPFLLYEGRPADLPALVIARPLGDASVHEALVVALERDTRPSGNEILAECTKGGRWRGIIACLPDAVPEGGRVVGGYALPIEPAAVAGTKETVRV